MNTLQGDKKNRIIGFLCVVCGVLAFSSVWFAFGENRYRKQERLMSERAISSLCESIDSISTSLRKSVYTADGAALEKIGNELCRQAASAKESLGLLSVDTELCDEVYRFLSQVGEYTLAVARNNLITDRDKISQLQKLSEYADSISSGFNEICLDYYNGDVSLGEAMGNLDSKGESIPEDFYVRLSDAAQSLTDYPSLIYDGPFSDSMGKKESVFLEGKNELTCKEAMKKVAAAFAVPESVLKKEEDILSQPERYCFSLGGNDVTVTKKGGYICTFMTDTYAFEENIGVEEAIKRGKAYLEKLGYSNMTSSYYSVYDGVCTVNYAFEKDGVVFYADLIKVSIALDSGKMVGLDAKNYLLNHYERQLTAAELTTEQAKRFLLDSLEMIKVKLTVIPLDTGKEAYCYEFHCKSEDETEVLVYINAYTGKQEELLILLYSDGGVLTK